jgi:exosortase/archaeosortase family protein
VHIGENERILMVLGKDVTRYTEGINLATAEIIYWLIHEVFGDRDFFINGTILMFRNSIPIEIVWSCTGLKQLFMFSFILACYFGPLKKKLWFLPISLLILLAVNILRLVVIFYIIKDPFPEWFIPIDEWYNNRAWSNTNENYIRFYKDWFNVFHRDIFTWIYYDGVVFILWLIWEEKINKPYARLKKAIKNTPEDAG